MENEPEKGPAAHSKASYAAVTPHYFRTMLIPLRSGRDFEERDTDSAPHVALVNETFVLRYVKTGNPIGQHILRDRPNGKIEALEIIGVVGDAKQKSVGAPTSPEMYQPFAQAPDRRLWLAFRTSAPDLSGLQASVRHIIHEQDREVFVGNIEPMQNSISKTLAQPRFNTVLLGVFAAVATALAAIGVYGVIAYSVMQRTREIGIRMALGAERGQMLGMILRQSLTVVAVGVAFGLAGAFAATRVLAGLLYGVGSNDFINYASVVMLLGASAFLASYFPARRAMKVNPTVALRVE
jgi:putative ABC transport system permease protein